MPAEASPYSAINVKSNGPASDSPKSSGESKAYGVRPSGLARFIVWQTAVIGLVFLILGLVSGVNTTRLEQMADRVNAEASRMVKANNIAVELLMYRRDMLLYQLTTDSGLLISAEHHLNSVARLFDQLNEIITEPNERRSFGEILNAYAVFQEITRHSSGVRPEEVRGYVDRVTNSIEDYRRFMQQRMDATAEESRNLNRLTNIVGWSLFIMLPVLLAASGLALWRRIARPVFSLINAADRFGAEDLGARTPVHREDELGALSRTFNTMAEDFQAREKDRHDFMCAVVHDLNSPIAVIDGAARLLAKGLPADKAQNWLERILTQARRLGAMTDDLLENARIGMGNLQLNQAAADLSDLVNITVTEQRLVHPQRVINWQEAAPCEFQFDEKRISRILVNLITNAIKYSDAPSEIDVRLEADAKSAIVTIIDRGAGISDEEITELFKPFGRLARTERRVRGTGLGLFSVKSIVEAHGGRIHIDSKRGQGTTVRVELPRDETTAAPQ